MLLINSTNGCICNGYEIGMLYITGDPTAGPTSLLEALADRSWSFDALLEQVSKLKGGERAVRERRVCSTAVPFWVVDTPADTFTSVGGNWRRSAVLPGRCVNKLPCYSKTTHRWRKVSDFGIQILEP